MKTQENDGTIIVPNAALQAIIEKYELEKDDADKFLEELRKSAKKAMYVLSGEMAIDDHKAYIEHRNFAADVHQAAMM